MEKRIRFFEKMSKIDKPLVRSAKNLNKGPTSLEFESECIATNFATIRGALKVLERQQQAGWGCSARGGENIDLQGVLSILLRSIWKMLR